MTTLATHGAAKIQTGVSLLGETNCLDKTLVEADCLTRLAA